MIRLEFSAFARFLAALAAAMWVASLAACGGASLDPKSPPASSSPREQEPAPTSVEEAQQQIAAAKAELGGATRAAPGESPKTGATSAPTAPVESPATADSRPPPMSSEPTLESQQSAGARGAPGARKAGTGDGDRCAGPCRALGSMRRAVAALCRMTGSDDTRCVDAKRTLADSERHVSPCAC